MDNFMEQPTYKMNRGAILAQAKASTDPILAVDTSPAAMAAQ
jgi:hypothetical protein